jgi:hypothetical protein
MVLYVYTGPFLWPLIATDRGASQKLGFSYLTYFAGCKYVCNANARKVDRCQLTDDSPKHKSDKEKFQSVICHLDFASNMNYLAFQKFQVAPYTFKLATFQRAVFKNGFKAFLGHFFPVGGAKVQQGGYGRKSRFQVRFGKTVPGAHILAGIAAKYPVIKPAFHAAVNHSIF